MSSIAENELAVTAALRAELEEELRNKKQCTYPSYECTQLCLEGYKFCVKHILQDKNAPFKQCSYVFSSNGKRCHLPAPRSDKKDFGYCNEHALRATLARNKQNSKNQPPRTPEVLLNSLSHYVKKPKNQLTSTSYSQEDHLIIDEKVEQKATKYNDPFVDLDANSIYNDHCNAVLEYNSESESDVEPSTLSSIWHDAHIDSSDDESIDSEQEDPLKHANIYTAEEVTAVIRDKLIKLQSLYVEQYRHLQYLLKEKRRKYLHALKREKETCCNIYNQVRDNPKEQRLYKKLKSLNNYQKTHGVDAILNKRLKDLRAKTNEATTSKPPASLKCVFTQGGVKCGERTLPLTKYCKKHILEDPNQILFRACGKINDDVECTTPIAAIFDSSTCHLHMDVPSLKSYNQIRKDSESDMDDSTEAINTTNYSTDNFTDNIKHEFVPYDIPTDLPKMETVPSLLFEENSQSLSESTISQNEILNMSNTNLNLSTNNIDVNGEAHNQMGFYQISESCTIVPCTSGITINSSTSCEQQMQTCNEPPLNALVKEDKTFLDKTLQSVEEIPKTTLPEGENSDQILESNIKVDQVVEINQYEELNTSDVNTAVVELPTTEYEAVLVDSREMPLSSEDLSTLNDNGIQTEANKPHDGLSKSQKFEEISEMEIVDMEIETGTVTEDQKCESQVEEEVEQNSKEQNTVAASDIEVCMEEELNTSDVNATDVELDTETVEEDEQIAKEQNTAIASDMEVCMEELNTSDVNATTVEISTETEVVLDDSAKMSLSSEVKNERPS